MRPCFYCWWHFGNRRWMRTLPLDPPRSTSRKIVLFVPRPWYRRCRRHNWQATPPPLTCLACMIRQDVSALPTSNPHGGPTTHRSTGSKPDCPVHPLFPKLFLARGLVCNSRATVLVIYSGIRRNTYSRYSEPFLTLVQTSSNYLSAWNLLLYLCTLLSMYFICSTREIILYSFMG